MSVLLFKLRSVEDDEAEEIRALLDANQIDYYETTNGRWGMGFAAIWLHDSEYVERAKALIDAYQKTRYSQAKEEYTALHEQGLQPTVWRMVRKNPFASLLAIFGIVAIVLFVLLPYVVW